jgi:hypothetical protein
VRLAFVICLTSAALACEREPLDVSCPPVGEGGLVVTEIRGPQGVDDALGQWIEIHNPGGAAVPLAGLQVRVRKLDGSGTLALLVRDGELSVPAGGYAVFGRFVHGDEPAHVDYGYADDFETDLYGDGVIDLVACGAVVDSASYGPLPSTGTLARGAADSWCVDASMAGAGTPGEGNPTCP